jgi:hypothetical protein
MMGAQSDRVQRRWTACHGDDGQGRRGEWKRTSNFFDAKVQKLLFQMLTQMGCKSTHLATTQYQSSV